MTLAELQELTSEPFDGIALCENNNDILFAAPIPSPWGDDLRYFLNEDGSFDIEGDVETWKKAWEQYIASLPQKRKNRTRKQAADQGAITNIPTDIAIITLKQYQNAMTPIDDKHAHLQPIMRTLAETLQENYGAITGQDMEPDVNFVEYYDNNSQTVSDLDLMPLRALYTLFLAHVQDIAKTPSELLKMATAPGFTKESIKIYIPDFMRMIGLAPNHNKANEDAVLNKIASYAAVYGVLISRQGKREYRNHYPVLQLVEHDDANNTIEIMSPYFHALIGTIIQASIKKDKNDKPKLKSNGEPATQPAHSYLIQMPSNTRKYKRAMEIVCVVVALIEQCGDGGTPHIKVQTILDRCPDLKYGIDKAKTSSDKTTTLKRAFRNAWALLETNTTLRDHYKNIKFPTVLPTIGSLDMVIEFPHEGKIKTHDKEKSETIL